MMTNSDIVNLEYKENAQDVAERILAKKDFFRPKNIQEAYLAGMMGDVIRAYYAAEETLKLVNAIEVKTDKIIEDLRDASKGLLLDVSEAKEEIDQHRSSMEQAMFASIEEAAKYMISNVASQLKVHQHEYSEQVLEHSIKLGQCLDARFDRLTSETDKRNAESVMTAKNEILSVTNKINTNKLFIYALLFSICSSFLTGLVVFSIKI